jgi:hypothetical protein
MLPKQRFHDLGHACISLLSAQGVPLKVVSEIVGHSDIRLTQSVYAHVYDEAKSAAAAKMDSLLVDAGVGAENPAVEPVPTRIPTKSRAGTVN